MIAEILNTFSGSTLSHKISYQMNKIDDGVARELYNSSGSTLAQMYSNMEIVSSLNDRVKSPYIEFVLSSPVGENLTDEQFLQVAQDYLSSMGYADSCYCVIKNEDKDNPHIHILATTIDLNGKWISDSFSRERSGKIMRDLEKKHGLQSLENGLSSNKSHTLGESQYRKYYFDAALHKALRSHNAKDRINDMLQGSELYQIIQPDLNKAYTNDEWKIMLGDESYDKIFDMLHRGRFFNPLYKDELLAAMDRIYPECNNMYEFRTKLKEEGYYCRLVSDRGKSHYVYGIPDSGFYIKDTSLPERYRYGKITFAPDQMEKDEQKHYLYTKIFSILNESSGYDDFKQRLEDNEIKLIEHVNGQGIYGISFAMTNVKNPEMFKGSDISRRLTYKAVNDYFQRSTGQEESREPNRERIEPVIDSYRENRQEWERDLSYMYPLTNGLNSIALEAGGKERKRPEDDLPSKKKKKKNKGLSI